jgi:hypothetical protein
MMAADSENKVTNQDAAKSGVRSGNKSKPGPEVSGAGVKDSSETEIGGPKGPEPTRYGDWERKGRCVDF